MPPVYALDFDGVVCDSAAETAIAGVLAAAQLWKTPELTAAAKDARTGGAPAWLTDALRAARPVVETGYEVVLMARALCEAGATDAPALAQRILSGWPPMRDVYMADWDVTKEVLVENFGEVRDAWIRDDLSSWVAANHLYVSCPSACRHGPPP